MRMVKASIAALTVAGASLWGALAPAPASAKDIVINMAAPDWLPTRFMQEEFDKSYKSKTGNNVKLVIDFIPWGSFYQRVAASLSSGEKKYQMIVTDSQWLGDFVEGGHYLKLNKYIDADPELAGRHRRPASGPAVDFILLSLQVEELLRLPAIPGQSRHRLTGAICSATRRSGRTSRSSTTRSLPCYYNEWEDVDWDRYENIGKFFQRKKGDKLGDGVADDDFYGIAYQMGKPYDFSSMQMNGFIWEAGGDIWDETSTKPALGVVNSDNAVKAFDHYLSLEKYMPPVAKTGQMDIFVVQDLYMQGKVAAIVDWVGVMRPRHQSQTLQGGGQPPSSPSLRARASLTARLSRWSNIGGQPFVLTTWNSDEVIKEALDIVKWWVSKPVQIKFVKAGGQSGLLSVMNDPAYATWAPYNRAYLDNYRWQKDVWHIPEFFPLLTEQQEQIDKAVTGQVTAKQALDTVAAFQDKLLREAGRIK